jgi:hypothetical protein
MNFFQVKAVRSLRRLGAKLRRNLYYAVISLKLKAVSLARKLL